MSPDDPRHGTYAGAQAHWKAKQKLCPACQDATYLYKKRARIRMATQGPNRVPLGDSAYRILTRLTDTQIHESTGLRRNQINAYRALGPEQIVLRATREKILGATAPYTNIGIQRRLRALAVQGWSARAVSERAGVTAAAIVRMRTRRQLHYVHREFAVAVCDAFDDLAYTPAPPSRHTHLARACALRAGWVAAAAWDDIDLDEAPSTGELSVGPRKSGPKPLDLDEFDYLVSAGESEHQAARQLGVTLAAVERAKFRAAARESAA